MKHLNMTPELYEYMLDKSLQEHAVLKALREDTATMELGKMMVDPAQAQFMQFLLRLMGAKKVLELGTFTGYSALAMSLALPEDGTVITCDINKNWTAKAPDFWKQAQQENKIQLKLGPALETLAQLIEQGWEQQFDFIFIDADKANYVRYYELALKLINPKGVIAIDNVFWSGVVLDDKQTGGQVREIRKLNELIKNDPRVHRSLVAIADGMFLIQPVA